MCIGFRRAAKIFRLLNVNLKIYKSTTPDLQYILILYIVSIFYYIMQLSITVLILNIIDNGFHLGLLVFSFTCFFRYFDLPLDLQYLIHKCPAHLIILLINMYLYFDLSQDFPCYYICPHYLCITFSNNSPYFSLE